MATERGGKKAFTLVELLVVISIIALLLAILMPALNKVRRQGKQVVCSSNVRQLNLAMRCYVDENKDNTPAVTYTKGEYWFHLIAPYLGTKKDKNQGVILKTAYCPEATKVIESGVKSKMDTAGKKDRAYYWSSGSFSGSYGMNMWLTPQGDYSPFVRNNPYAIGKPENYYQKFSHAKSNVPVFADCIWTGAFPLDKDTAPRTLDGDWLSYGIPRFYIDRHMMSIDIGFADMSTKKVLLKELWRQKWNPVFQCKDMPTSRKSN